jgi:hypothetical protein
MAAGILQNLNKVRIVRERKQLHLSQGISDVGCLLQAEVRGGRGCDIAQGVLFPPPCTFDVPFPSYYDISVARIYFASTITSISVPDGHYVAVYM